MPDQTAQSDAVFPYDPRLQLLFEAALTAVARFPQDAASMWEERVRSIADAAPVETVDAFLEVTPYAVAATSAAPFRRWVTLCEDLADLSPDIAIAFLRSTPFLLSLGGGRHLAQWAELGFAWARNESINPEWATEYFEASPMLVKATSLPEVEQLLGILRRLPQDGPVSPHRAFEAAYEGFAGVPKTIRRQLLTTGERIASTNPWALGLYVEAGLRPIAAGARVKQLLENLAHVTVLEAQPPRYWHETTENVASLPAEMVGPLLAWAVRISKRSPIAAQELLRSCKALGQHLSPEAFVRWCQRGEDAIRINEGEGISYFRLQSYEAQQAITQLSAGVSIREIHDILQLYSQALMGETLPIISLEATQAGTVHPGEGNWERDQAAIFIPSFLNEYPTKDANFEAIKVLVTHQTSHLAFGTYDFSFERDGTIFRPLRKQIDPVSDADAETPFRRFFNLFQTDRELAQTLFTLGEDVRIEALLWNEYKGIREASRRIQKASLDARPPLMEANLREYLLEVLLRNSLSPGSDVLIPRSYKPLFEAAAGIMSLLQRRDTLPEDVVEAALRIYTVARQIPNIPAVAVPSEEWVHARLSDSAYDPDAEDLDELLAAFEMVDRSGKPISMPSEESGQVEGVAEQPFSAPPPPTYRLDPSPEAMQMLLHILEGEDGEDREEMPRDNAERPTDLEAMKELFAKLDPTQQPDAMLEWISTDPMEGRSTQEQSTSSDIKQASPLVGSVAETDVQEFVYDEWDYRLRTYRPNWCHVRQRTLKQGTSSFYRDTLARYGLLVHAVRKQFELLKPEAMARLKRLLDGEEIDLDAAIERVTDRRAGQAASDKVYWRRRPNERSVSVAVLLDMSLSTDERVAPEMRGPSGRGTFSPPSMQVNAGKGKRIIELEKESLVLLIEALEKLGDEFAIYGFSSAGRDDVQFYVAKGLTEAISEATKSRISSIVPLQGTRMGAAIRHAYTQLLQSDARTKILLLLSDGRPQDRDYGNLPWELERPFAGRFRPADNTLMRMTATGSMSDEQEYAVHDTKEAMNEARAKGVTPFCLSIDKGGYDYLRVMCGDIGYEVVSDIEALPRRLTSLYRRLTT